MADPDTTRKDAMVMRRVLQRELETINAYEDLLDQLSSPELKQALAHIRDEEKEHVAETLHFVRRLDPAQEAVFQGALDVLQKPASVAPARPSPGPLTIGSLKRRTEPD